MGELERLFKESGFTLTEISKLSGVSLSTTFKYIKDQVKNPNPDYYEPIYKVLSGTHTEIDEEDNDIEVIKEAEVIKDDEIIENKKVIKENIQQIINAQASDSEYSDEIGIDPVKVKVAIEGNAFKEQKPYANNTNPKRGEIYYVKNNIATGSEQWGSRPAVIISSDKLNESMPTVEVMFITGSPKQELPTHCTISTDRDLSVVLGEQISSVSKNRLGNFLNKVTDAELSIIERVALISLGIKHNSVDVKHSTDYVMLQKENAMLREFIEKLTSIAMK